MIGEIILKMKISKSQKERSGNTLLLVLHSLIIILYTCRALFLHYSIIHFEYYFSITLVFVYMILILPRINILIRNSKLFLIFFTYGIFCLLISIANNGLILSLMGFSSIFLNAFLWTYFSVFSKKKDYEILKKVFLICMFVNAIVAIYQFYIDASFFGIISGIYGDESIMEMDNITRRSVGFMGSPQSFSATIGVSLFVTYSLKKKHIKWPLIALFVFAGVLSNSRAFGIALILFLILVAIKLPIWKLLIITFGGIAAYIFASIVLNYGVFNIDTIVRTFDFSKWAAKSIYFSSFEGNGFLDCIIGRGYGLSGWNSNINSLSFDFSSTESYVTSILGEIGLIGLMIYIVWILSLLFKNKGNKVFLFMLIYIFINSCFTPAFCGFAFSYVAWFAIVNVSKFGENLERGDICCQKAQNLKLSRIYY